MINKLELTAENLSTTLEELEKNLSETKADKKEIMRAELLVEETFMRLNRLGKAENVTLKISKRFGEIILKLEAAGEEYNPLVEVTDWNEEDEDYFRTMILKANRPKMSYARKNNLNTITIQVHDENNRQLWYIVGGMILGIAFGALAKDFFSPEILESVSKDIIGSVMTIFMDALNTMIAPVIFFSIVSGIAGMTNASEVGRIGGKIVVLYVVTSLISSAVGLASAKFFFGDLPQTKTLPASVDVQNFSMVDFVVGIVPKNLAAPIVDSNVLQIIFLSIIFGIGISQLGDKIKILNDVVKECTTLSMKIMTIIVSFMPLIAFFAMAQMMIELGGEATLILVKTIAILFLSCVTIFVMYPIIIALIGKISPLPLLKKLPTYLPIPVATASSSVSMPFTMNFCTEKLGISPKLSSFSIPLGATINMNGTTISYAIFAIILLRMYGVDVTTNVMVTLLISIFSMAVGTPGIPGGGIIAIGAIIGVFGVPLEAIALFLGISPICDRIVTPLNVIGDIASTLLVAKNENLLDEKIYNS